MIIKLSLFFLIGSLIIDPTGDFYSLKYLSAALALLVFGANLIMHRKIPTLNFFQVLIYLTFALIMPLYGLLITFLNSGLNKISDTSYLGFSSFLLILFPAIFIEAKTFLKILIIALRVLSCITVLILLSFLYDTDSLGIAQFFIDKKSMLVGFREYGGIKTYFLYFTAAPLLIILVAYDAYNLYNKITLGNIILCFISICSIFLTGTRFNMLMAIIILPTIIAVYNFSIGKIWLYLTLFFIFLIILSQSSFISSFFNSNDNSNSVKIGYLETYTSIFKDPKVIVFGQGFSGYDNSVLFKNMLIKFENEGVKTELTFIELYRVFGVIFGSFFNLVLFSAPFFLYK
ncbi:MAG: hypothetical protein EOO96_24315, partial [Pedobacter sp.]